ncbi:MAG: hypothetical protein EOO08_01200 [Chitinophagaceae bacterium]|nr:MAG: hypothetical protein EOO08_01200 [Chitinophagaceae bacterium]
MKPRMHPFSRILVALAAASMSLCFVLPAWFIYLLAPQYPEGLTMYIWLDHLSGDVTIINGLNHYIGMKHIDASMFPEFTYLRYILGGIILLGLLVAFTGRRKHLFFFVLLLVGFAGAALYDFYSWGYDYGHHLDPKAAIQVPGLFYQPPVVGHKKLLNFDAYSYPDSGGWIVIGAGLLCIAVWSWERFLRKGARPSRSVVLPGKSALAASVLLLFTLSSCSQGLKPFQVGRDACADCRMTIADVHYGAELITSKGRTYVFDDLRCLAHFRKANVAAAANAQLYFADYERGTLVPAAQAWVLTDTSYQTPMNSHSVAFSDRAAADRQAKGSPQPGLTALEKL